MVTNYLDECPDTIRKGQEVMLLVVTFTKASLNQYN